MHPLEKKVLFFFFVYPTILNLVPFTFHASEYHTSLVKIVAEKKKINLPPLVTGILATPAQLNRSGALLYDSKKK